MLQSYASAFARFSEQENLIILVQKLPEFLMMAPGVAELALALGATAVFADEPSTLLTAVETRPSVQRDEDRFLGPLDDSGSNIERSTLVKFFETLNGSMWVHSTGWLTGNPCEKGEEWYGVQCETEPEVGLDCSGTHVVGLVLPMNGLRGTLPAELSQLECLRNLDLSLNDLTSNIQPDLFTKTSLVSADLSYNALSFNASVLAPGVVKNLKTLDLSWNSYFWGTLAHLADAAPELESLILDRMELTGSSLSSLKILKQLELVSLKHCALDGAIADLGDIETLTNLRKLDLSNNFLSGVLPKSFSCRFPALEELRLNNNHLDGSVTAAFFFCFESLEEFVVPCNWHLVDLSDNHFNFLDLTGIFESNNKTLTKGGDTKAIHQLKQADRKYVDIKSNLCVLDLSGNPWQPMGNNLQTMLRLHPNLQNFKCSACSLKGELNSLWACPKKFTTQSDGGEVAVPTIGAYLQLIQLDHNSISNWNDDIIGLCFCQHTHLKELSLHNNLFVGTLPSCVLELPELEALDISRNGLQKLPLRTKVSRHLSNLRLYGNHLSGRIPIQQLETVAHLHLADNDFTSCDEYGSTFLEACWHRKRCFDKPSQYKTVNLCGNSQMHYRTANQSQIEVSNLSQHFNKPLFSETELNVQESNLHVLFRHLYPHYQANDPVRRYFKVCGTRNHFFVNVLTNHGWLEFGTSERRMDEQELDTTSIQIWSVAYGTCNADESLFQALDSMQIMSRFVFLDPVADKGRLSLNVDRARRRGAQLSYYPLSFELPRQFEAWRHMSRFDSLWLLKPRSQCCGRGIRLVDNNLTQENLTAFFDGSRGGWYIQKFVHPPRLVNKMSKFVFRLFAIVTSLVPLRVYLYNDGLVFYTQPDEMYSTASAVDLMNLNKRQYITDYFFTDAQTKYAMTSRDLLRQLADEAKNEGTLMGHNSSVGGSAIDEDGIWTSLRKITGSILLSAQDELSSVQRRHPSGTGFEVLGLDVAFDINMQPHLCEVNSAPNLGFEVNYANYTSTKSSSSNYEILHNADRQFKQELMEATLDLAGVQPIFSDWQTLGTVAGENYQQVFHIISRHDLNCSSDIPLRHGECLGNADVKYLKEIHIEMLRLYLFQQAVKSDSDELLRHHRYNPLLRENQSNSVDRGRPYFEPAYPFVGCMQQQKKNGTVIITSTIFEVALREERKHLLGAWWWEVLSIALDNHFWTFDNGNTSHKTEFDPLSFNQLKWPTWLHSLQNQTSGMPVHDRVS